MLTEIAAGVFVHESAFIKSNSTVVEGSEGVLLADPGITRSELACLAGDLRGKAVIAGFSTHPDWDHALWTDAFGAPPRYATPTAARTMADFLAQADWRQQLEPGLPPEHIDDIPLDLLGALTPLPAGADLVPWDGPDVRIIEHRAHAPGHAALLIEHARVLVAGDMLSDILMPFLDLSATDPIGDYLSALTMFDGVADLVDVVVPGHGSVGDGEDLVRRLQLDRAYVEALGRGDEPADPRIGPTAPLGWLADVHVWQMQRLNERL